VLAGLRVQLLIGFDDTKNKADLYAERRRHPSHNPSFSNTGTATRMENY
jgi:hypothetical protein